MFDINIIHETDKSIITPLSSVRHGVLPIEIQLYFDNIQFKTNWYMKQFFILKVHARLDTIKSTAWKVFSDIEYKWVEDTIQIIIT